jgi:hypothetical protein
MGNAKVAPVPAVTSSGPPVFTNHYMTLHNFHRDVVLDITLDTRAVVSDFDLKTWGFLMYLDCSDDHSPDFDILVRQILMDGILPLAQYYFQVYFFPVVLHIRFIVNVSWTSPRHSCRILLTVGG